MLLRQGGRFHPTCHEEVPEAIGHGWIKLLRVSAERAEWGEVHACAEDPGEDRRRLAWLLGSERMAGPGSSSRDVAWRSPDDQRRVARRQKQVGADAWISAMSTGMDGEQGDSPRPGQFWGSDPDASTWPQG